MSSPLALSDLDRRRGLVAVALFACCGLWLGCSAESNSSGDPDTGAEVTDEGDADDVAIVDVTPDTETSCPGKPGCECTADADCPGGGCVASSTGKVCAGPCTAQGTCTAGKKCAVVTLADDTTSKLCVPRSPYACNPCKGTQACISPADINARCVAPAGDAGKSGWYCAPYCAATTDCPVGYKCAEVDVFEGGKSKQCVPLDGVCNCSLAAKNDALATVCFATAFDGKGQLIGKCPGERYCTTVGLSPCDAAKPWAELCDGLDSDCDGATDDNGCDDLNACTTDTCTADLKCEHVDISATCDDGDQCTANTCEPAKGCTYPKAPLPCNDNDACTGSDVCAAGKCGGKLMDCSDGNACTADFCVDGKCKHSVTPGPCDDGDACTKDDVCAAGNCVASPLFCSDKNACTNDSCDPKTGCVFTPNANACNDSDACTGPDVCSGGACTTQSKSCDDDNICTNDSCDPKMGCTYLPVTVVCSDGNGCTVGDVCWLGECKPGAATVCNDDNPCTSDSCNTETGKCVFTTLEDGSGCDDGSKCTTFDKCVDGKCKLNPVNCDDENPCTVDSCDPATGFCTSVKLDAVPCEDGNDCTGPDVCAMGQCIVGKKLTGTLCDNGQKMCQSGTCI